MIRINLIPHREAFRKQQIIEHITVFVVSVVLVIMLVGAVDMWASQELADLQEEQALLKSKNRALSKKIGELRNLDSLRKDVESKLAIVDELQEGRFRSLNTLHAVAKSIPQNIWLSSLKDASGKISLVGMGESSQAVASFMRALALSEYFDDVQLLVDEAAEAEGVKVRKFTLRFRRLTLAEREANKKGEESKP